MIKNVGYVLFLLAACQVGAEDGDLSLTLIAPDLVGIDEPFEITIAATNEGKSPLVFKRHQSWSDQTWHLEFENSNGVRENSRPGLGEPPDSQCSYYVLLDPGQTVHMEFLINKGWPPHYYFPGPGQYRLRLVYRSESETPDENCSFDGISTWYGRTISNWIEIPVNKKPYLKSVPKDIADLPMRVDRVDPTLYEKWRSKGDAQGAQRSNQSQWELPVYVSSTCKEDPEFYQQTTRDYIQSRRYWRPGTSYVGGLEHLRVDFICSTQFRFLLASEGGIGNHGTRIFSHVLRAWWMENDAIHNEIGFHGHYDFSIQLMDNGESVDLRYAASGDCADCEVQLEATIHLVGDRPGISISHTP